MSLHTLYRKLVAPKATEAQAQSREITLNTLLVGTLGLGVIALVIVLLNLLIHHRPEVLMRLVVCAVVVGFILTLYLLSRAGKYKTASYLFVLLYFLVFMGMVGTWSIQIPQGILLAAFVIILSGILLGSKFALYAALVETIALLVLLYGTDPDISWKVTAPSAGDVVIFGTTFGLIAVVCWLFNSQIERSLQRAERSEAALRRQKELLEIKVEQRTKKLQAIQLDQIQQVYRFAELGLVSTALLHDLANQLSAISLDIEGIEATGKTPMLSRIKHTITYIDGSVQKTREQLHGRGRAKRFLVNAVIDEAIDIAQYKASHAGVAIEAEHRATDTVRLLGEDVRLKQVLINLITNGVDAYERRAKRPIVTVRTEQKHDSLILSVIDFGNGLSAEQQKHLFQPFYTSKKHGMGLGLFISKEIITKSFSGRITYRTTDPQGTTFVIKIPINTS